MASQEVFLLIDADNISPKVDRAIRNNKPDSIAQMSQDIERGDKLLRAWLEERSGRVLLFHGDEIYASVAGEHLADLGKLHEQLQDCWNDTITIGVGLDLREAKKALDAGKKRGGSRILFYAPEIEQMVGEEESQSDSHNGKIGDPAPDKLKQLNKSNTPVQPRGVHAIKHDSLRNDGGGLSPYTPQQPVEGDGSDMPPPPSVTHAADNLSPVERQFHQMASQGEAEAARSEGQALAAAQGGPSGDEIKQTIAKILMKVKQQAPILEQLQQQAPEAYQAVVGAIQAMLLMAKTFGGGKQEAPKEEAEAVQKTEKFIEEALFKSARDIRRIRAATVNDEIDPQKLNETVDFLLANLKELENYQDTSALLGDLSENPQLTTEAQHKLINALGHGSSFARHLLKKGKPLSPEMEAAFVNSKDLNARRNIARFKGKLSPESVEKLSQDRDHDVVLSVKNRPDLTATAVRSLIENKNMPSYLRPVILKHPLAPADLILKEIARRRPHHRVELLEHPSIPQEHFDKHLAANEKVASTPLKITASQKTRDNHQSAVGALREFVGSHRVPLEKARELHEKILKPLAANTMSGYSTFQRDVDPIHATNKNIALTDVRPGLHKLRKIRDFIESKGGEAKPADIGGAAQSLGKAGRLPNGNFSSKLLQEHIDALPALPLYLSKGSWGGGQQHSQENSKVLRVSLPTKYTEEMLKRGIRMKDGHSGGHPGEPVSGLGWVRYTGDHRGIHIDEIQHDFGPEAEKKFREVLGHPVHQVLHDAFHEFARKNFPIGTPVHIWTPESKAPLSGQDTDIDLPVHMRNTYGAGPEKMAYTPGQYGKLPTQKNKHLKGEAVWTDEIRKSEELFELEEPLAKTAAEIRQIKSKMLDDNASEADLNAAIDKIVANKSQTASRISDWYVEYLQHNPKFTDDMAVKLLSTFTDSTHLPEQILDGHRGKNLSPALEQILANSPAYNVRRVLAQDFGPTLSPETTAKLLTDTDITARHNIISRGRLSPEQISSVIAAPQSVQNHTGALLERKDLAPEHIRSLWNIKGNNHQRPSILLHPNTPVDVLASTVKKFTPRSARTLETSQLLAAALHPNFPQEQFDKLFSAALKVAQSPRPTYPPRIPGIPLSQADKNARYRDEAMREHSSALVMKAIKSHKVPLETARALWGQFGTYEWNEAKGFSRDPDALHSAQQRAVAIVKPGLHRIRQLRDQIEAQGGELRPADLGPGANTLGRVGRLPNGNFSSALIQQHIDSHPGLPLYLTQGVWQGGQRHSDDSSKVLRVSLPTAMTEQLLKEGVRTKEGYSSSHPGEPISGLGWIRYTGDDTGIHIDEIQHDFGPDKEKVLKKLLGHPVHQVLHDAFHEFARKNLPVGTPVHIWTPQSKAPLSGQSLERALPVHMMNTYEAGPQKMGYKAAQYGAVPTQSRDKNKGAPTYQDQVRKMEKAYEIVSDHRESKRTGIDNQVKVQNTDFSIKKSSMLRGPRAIAKAAGGKVEPRMDRPYPNAQALDKEELPTPEEQAKHNTPKKPHGGIAIHVEGQNTIMPFREFHQDPGQAAHISNSGKLDGKTVYRRSYSGRVLPDNHAEATSGAGHINGVSGRDAKDGKASDPQPGPNPGGGQNPSGKH